MPKERPRLSQIRPKSLPSRFLPINPQCMIRRYRKRSLTHRAFISDRHCEIEKVSHATIFKLAQSNLPIVRHSLFRRSLKHPTSFACWTKIASLIMLAPPPQRSHRIIPQYWTNDTLQFCFGIQQNLEWGETDRAMLSSAFCYSLSPS